MKGIKKVSKVFTLGLVALTSIGSVFGSNFVPFSPVGNPDNAEGQGNLLVIAKSPSCSYTTTTGTLVDCSDRTEGFFTVFPSTFQNSFAIFYDNGNNDYLLVRRVMLNSRLSFYGLPSEVVNDIKDKMGADSGLDPHNSVLANKMYFTPLSTTPISNPSLLNLNSGEINNIFIPTLDNSVENTITYVLTVNDLTINIGENTYNCENKDCIFLFSNAQDDADKVLSLIESATQKDWKDNVDLFYFVDSTGYNYVVNFMDGDGGNDGEILGGYFIFNPAIKLPSGFYDSSTQELKVEPNFYFCVNGDCGAESGKNYYKTWTNNDVLGDENPNSYKYSFYFNRPFSQLIFELGGNEFTEDYPFRKISLETYLMNTFGEDYNSYYLGKLFEDDKYNDSLKMKQSISISYLAKNAWKSYNYEENELYFLINLNSYFIPLNNWFFDNSWGGGDSHDLAFLSATYNTVTKLEKVAGESYKFAIDGKNFVILGEGDNRLLTTKMPLDGQPLIYYTKDFTKTHSEDIDGDGINEKYDYAWLEIDTSNGNDLAYKVNVVEDPNGNIGTGIKTIQTWDLVELNGATVKYVGQFKDKNDPTILHVLVQTSTNVVEYVIDLEELKNIPIQVS